MVFGIVSLILWALIFIVTIKYVLFILRADNNGEGGTLTLMALAQRAMGHNVLIITLLGMVGAALFYGDAIITPAISVLSAVEGLTVASPAFAHYVLPLSLVILVGLFAVQSHGTARVAAWFGPITAVWFVLMAVGGLVHIADDPSILAAISPTYGVVFLATHGTAGLFALGAVFLAVTGAEALYADMGHFGRRPIQTAWLGLVLPCLALNYIGQGALLLADPAKIENPFFLLYPDWALLPMVGMATIATIIASQAVITGAFSLTQQAIQLGLLPRMEIRWTSETEKGQIYVPKVNFLLLLAVLFLVITFKSSSALAHAYGIAVTGTMVVDRHHGVLRGLAVLEMAAVAVGGRHCPVPDRRHDLPGRQCPEDPAGRLDAAARRCAAGHADADVATRYAHPVREDPKRRRAAARTHQHAGEEPAASGEGHGRVHDERPRHRPGGPAAQPQAQQDPAREERGADGKTEDAPRVADDKRVRIEHLGDVSGGRRMTLRLHGGAEHPTRSRAPAKAGLQVRHHGHIVLRLAPLDPALGHGGMPFWQDKLFISLAKSASDATDFFQIPTGRVVEVGTQVTI